MSVRRLIYYYTLTSCEISCFTLSNAVENRGITVSEYRIQHQYFQPSYAGFHPVVELNRIKIAPGFSTRDSSEKG